MTSKKCYARFMIMKNEIGASKYIITFKIKNRLTKTKMLSMQSNRSKDISTVLKENETIKDCNAFVDLFLKNDIKINSKPLLLQVYDVSLEREINNFGDSIPSMLKHHTLFSFSITRSKTRIDPNNKLTQSVASMNNAPMIPSGLRWVSYLRDVIKTSASNNNVDKMAIASIIFQEKYHGIWADRKNDASLILKGYNKTASYGFAEMQLGLAADLLGFTKEKNPNYLKLTYDIITTDANIAIDLVGKLINLEQQKRKRKLNVKEATTLYNGGVNALNSLINGEIPKNTIIASVYGRSWEWQNAISMALEGIVIGQPDNCKLRSCNAYVDKQTAKWKKQP